MLVVPFVVGAIARAESGEPVAFLVPLLVCWMTGYAAFFTASGWLKAPAARRARWVRPFLIESGITLLAGLCALALTGPHLAWWIPVFAVLLLPALALAWRRRERDWTGGLLTVAAASAMTLVARYPDPGTLASAPDLTHMLIITGATFAYFFGTVLYVKTTIRERGSRPFYTASLLWHLAATVAAAGLALAGLTTWWWTAFFAVTTMRAAVVPRLSPPPRPKTIGLAEGALSLALVLGAAII